MTEPVDTLSELLADPVLAHEVLFRHRHAHPTPPFHRRLIRLIHSPRYHRLLLLCFRGSGKSTLIEEAITLLALTSQAHNILIIGESWLRACDRLRSIRRELADNDELIELFGASLGPTWQEGRIILSNGVAVTASGAGQALRGTKHLEHRPDLCIVDDLESIESASSAEQRRKLADWFYSDLLPALDPSARLIVLATPLHPQSLASSLLASAKWEHEVVPVTTHDVTTGLIVSSWPERFPLSAIAAERESYARAGKAHRYAQEFDMVSRDVTQVLFEPTQFRFDPLLCFDAHPSYIAIDPARTVKETSSTTGVAVASWVGRRLVVWEATPCRITPAELVDLVFRLDERYAPITIGVERDGLEEFLLQPLRHAMLARSRLIPLKALKAPRGKNEFIARLQPLFAAGDIVFAGSESAFAPAIEQFTSFPFGLVDVPNALAYLFELRPGLAVYEDASLEHRASLELRPGVVYLALNTGPPGTTAVMFQYVSGVVMVLRDWAAEGDAGVHAAEFIREAALDAGRAPRVIVPPGHLDGEHARLGLAAATRGVARLTAGGEPEAGRQVIRLALTTTHQGVPKLLVDPAASWTLRALYGGYHRLPGAGSPQESVYAVLMQGLEAACARLTQSGEMPQRMATLPSGERYATAEVERRHRP